LPQIASTSARPGLGRRFYGESQAMMRTEAFA